MEIIFSMGLFYKRFIYDQNPKNEELLRFHRTCTLDEGKSELSHDKFGHEQIFNPDVDYHKHDHLAIDFFFKDGLRPVAEDGKDFIENQIKIESND
jgi:hypothetical protein